MVSCDTHITETAAHYDVLDRTIDSYGIKNVSYVACATFHRTDHCVGT